MGTEIIPYDRRQKQVVIDFPDRRRGERRKVAQPVPAERRRFVQRGPSAVPGRHPKAQIPKIAAVATANPPNRFNQEEILALFGYEDTRRRSFFLNSDVHYRYLYIDRRMSVADETVDELHKRYREGSIEISREAARKCLIKANISPKDLNFIVAASSTGYLCPGLESILIKELGMKSDIQRANVLGMGSAGATVALQQAYNYLKAYPTRKALVVAVEICSAAYYIDGKLETAVANAIFGDGAAAALLATEGEGVEILGFRSLIKPEYLEFAGLGNVGGRLKIVLSKEIRHVGGLVIDELVKEITREHNITKNDIRFWILHPGARRIIDGIRDQLGLKEEGLSESRKILRDYGNMSAPTILFVLNEVIESSNPYPGDLGIMVALGPGLAVEGVLLRW